MELQELEYLVQQGEGQALEFKLKASFPEKIVKEMVAFANSSGGQLLVGVDDDHRIAGLKFAEEEQFILEKAIKTHARPGIRYQSRFIPINRKRSVLYFNVFENRKKPSYYLEDPNKRGKAYVRIDDKSVQASRELVEIMRRKSMKKSYPVQVGEKKQMLFQYIEAHGKATLADFMELSSLSRYKASQILVRLAVSNILKVHPGEGVDYFSMKITTEYESESKHC